MLCEMLKDSLVWCPEPSSPFPAHLLHHGAWRTGLTAGQCLCLQCPCHCRANLMAMSFLRAHEEWVKMLYPQGFSKCCWRKERYPELRYLKHGSAFLQLWGRCFERELSYTAASQFSDITSLATSFTKCFPRPLLNWLSLCSTRAFSVQFRGFSRAIDLPVLICLGVQVLCYLWYLPSTNQWQGIEKENQ